MKIVYLVMSPHYWKCKTLGDLLAQESELFKSRACKLLSVLKYTDIKYFLIVSSQLPVQ